MCRYKYRERRTREVVGGRGGGPIKAPGAWEQGSEVVVGVLLPGACKDEEGIRS